VVDLHGSLHISSLYEWSDGKQVVDTSTAYIRKLQSSITPGAHRSLQRWRRHYRWEPDWRKVWRNTWLPYRAAKENCFLWQILYRSPATQQWRLPKLSRRDRATHCTRCNKGTQEDILHCIWNCPQSLVVWDWVCTMLQLVSRNRQVSLELKFQHVLLAEDLPPDFLIPKKFWAIFRAVTCWEIWKARCSHFMEDVRTTPISIIRKIWYRVCIYLSLFWRLKCSKIRTGPMEAGRAVQQMQRDFRRSTSIWSVHDNRLHTPSLPPRPP
jgi:hypothetical protein